MTRSAEFSGDRLDLSAMQNLSSRLGQETETCGNLHMDSEQTTFLSTQEGLWSPLVPEGPARMSFLPFQGPLSLQPILLWNKQCSDNSGLHDIHL